MGYLSKVNPLGELIDFILIIVLVPSYSIGKLTIKNDDYSNDWRMIQIDWCPSYLIQCKE